MGIRNIVGVSLVALLAACTSSNVRMVSLEEFVSVDTAPVKQRQLRAGDKIIFSIEVNGKKEISSAEVMLNFAGFVPAPLIGDVNLDGLSLIGAREMLVEKYSRIFTAEPMVSLRMANGKQAGEWGYVTVLGQMRNPGRFPIVSIAGMNLSDALHEAGGFGDSANMEEIIVTRTIEGGTQLQCQCDITKMGKAGFGQVDLLLFDGDIIYVKERLF